MIIIETRPFARVRNSYFTEDSFAAFTFYLYRRPKIGEVIPGTGGIRKIRWQLPGRGRRGGIRIIYYLVEQQRVLYLLTAYAKNENQNLPRRTLRQMREAIENVED